MSITRRATVWVSGVCVEVQHSLPVNTCLVVTCSPVPCFVESIKDLIRYLRHEDDARDVRQQLGEGQIVQNDLLPIITQHRQDKTLFDACIR